MVEGWDCWDQAGLIQSLRGPKASGEEPVSDRNAYGAVISENQGRRHMDG